MAEEKSINTIVAKDSNTVATALANAVAMILYSTVPNDKGEPSDEKVTSLAFTRVTYRKVNRVTSINVPSGHSTYDMKGSTDHNMAVKVTGAIDWYDPDTMVRVNCVDRLSPGGDFGVACIYRYKLPGETSGAPEKAPETPAETPAPSEEKPGRKPRS